MLSISRGTEAAQRAICRMMQVIIAICVIDLILTLVLIDSGRFNEGNPLMRYYLEYGPLVFIAVKALFVAAPLAVAQAYRRINPALVAGTLKVATVGYLALYGFGFLLKNAGHLLN